MIAYLISAYTDPDHLARLIAALDHEADFYVHVDANVNDAPFRRLLPKKVHFVPRHHVSWGGWEQVAYQYELIKAVINSGRDYTHLVCLSAQDYPLWSNHRIHTFFIEHQDTEFIGGYNLSHTDNQDQLRKITHYHPFRDLPLRNRWLKNKLVVASRTLLSICGLRRRPQVLINGVRRDIYFGSDYWAITLDCARYVKKVLDTNPALVRYFRTTFVPSEMCIQTIVYNSSFGTRAQLYKGSFPGLVRLTPLHYLYYKGSVKALTMDDWKVIQESGKMFCRKVVSNVSDSLMNTIDTERSSTK